MNLSVLFTTDNEGLYKPNMNMVYNYFKVYAIVQFYLFSVRVDNSTDF
ncbi:hypothetical protein BWGOE4_24660 [Bacillus mycoides]|uniref:Uncharacterized protein n=1 Tax=Bacillus mycoides TaxID=1405 RepID=A0A1E8BNI0_BACMY|nr:hypothetical protein IEM_00125 [Bacillus cereus BAG6O-2]OFD42776.1 hypothetical protein BWGOE2_24010 [Bacillus mycoides]OFD46858.1 hypothetical protein BWGOE1_24600 [Bacillus mycoides]OFD49289.1 hypothetical protein BWGOE3_23940 [Bacillus mycoides]OFD60163.1 hypothetical protein BWGOE4_24660 [Bacillus mycoides]